MPLEENTHVTFTYRGEKLEGRIIQLHPNDDVTVKLDTGYNVIVPEKDMQDVESTPIQDKKPSEPASVKQDESLPKITILHTGGTIASKVDYATGGVSTNFSNEELLSLFPELMKIANVSSKFLRNMWSQDIRFPHYNILARAALEEITREVDGVIITHGTDFLHVTAAALSFALEGLNIPVMLVGSQRSSDRGSSDARSNLLGAAQFIKEGIPGVYVAMHENSSDDSIAIIDGLHARKMHSSRRDAFVSVNAPLFGRVKTGTFELLDKERAAAWKAQAADRPRVMPFKEDLKIGWWKTHPHSFLDELSPYDSYDGLIIEGSGLGHGPTTGIDEFTKEHPLIRERIGELSKKIPVVMTVQTIYGRVNMNVYTPQRQLLDLGVLGNNLDMIPETAFVKLAWLLSNHKDDVRTMIGENLRGEISERSSLEDSRSELE